MMATQTQVIERFIERRWMENDGTGDIRSRTASVRSNMLCIEDGSLPVGAGVVAEWWDDRVCLIEPDAADSRLAAALKSEIESRGLGWMIREDGM
jgi:hypothetical protein